MPQDTAPTEADDQIPPVPFFEDPDADSLRRVGVVDVGSNSVRLVVFDGAARSPAYFYNEKLMCGLGEGLRETGMLNPEGRVRALRALERFAAVAKSLGTGPLAAVATAAVREASDGPAFRREVWQRTGIHLRVIEGPEEARLSAQGVLLGWPGSYGLVCDIGGSSMELAEIRDGQVGKCVTSPLGPQQLMGWRTNKKVRTAYIREVIEGLRDQLGPQSDRLFLVGGSWRAIARIDMERRGYPLHVLHEYRMSRQGLRETLKWIKTADLEALRQACGISSARMALVPLAAEVLRELLRTFKPVDIAVSSYGIREGLLYEQMPQHLRDRDPLIEACRFSEAKDARLPGFGDLLYQFVKPLFSSAKPDVLRIVRAACLLHDVSWRAHPDYRAETCFDNATRANLGGMSHDERLFMGLALLHRYKNARSGTRFDILEPLMDEDTKQQAEVLGKAMRLGAMLWMRLEAKPSSLKFYPRKKVLELRLQKAAEPLFGEVAEARLASLASSLGAKTKVVRAG